VSRREITTLWCYNLRKLTECQIELVPSPGTLWRGKTADEPARPAAAGLAPPKMQTVPLPLPQEFDFIQVK